MRKMIVFVFFVLSLLLISVSCGEKPDKPQEAESFTPPGDGKITEHQKEAYIKASVALTEAMGSYSKMIDEFTEKYRINRDLTQMSDTSFIKKHPKIKKAWDELSKKWEDMQNKAYKKAGISEEEFNWIGGALTDSINANVQKEVEKALTKKSETEEGQKEEEE
jgi:hypothetical protein